MARLLLALFVLGAVVVILVVLLLSGGGKAPGKAAEPPDRPLREADRRRRGSVHRAGRREGPGDGPDRSREHVGAAGRGRLVGGRRPVRWLRVRPGLRPRAPDQVVARAARPDARMGGGARHRADPPRGERLHPEPHPGDAHGRHAGDEPHLRRRPRRPAAVDPRGRDRRARGQVRPPGGALPLRQSAARARLLPQGHLHPLPTQVQASAALQVPAVPTVVPISAGVPPPASARSLSTRISEAASTG